MSDYPKMMFRHNPESPVTDRLPCDIVTVCDEAGEKAARAEGWHDNVADAHPKPKAPKPEPNANDGEDPRVALRAEYAALSGKNAFGGWSADVLAEKIAALKEPKQ